MRYAGIEIRPIANSDFSLQSRIVAFPAPLDKAAFDRLSIVVLMGEGRGAVSCHRVMFLRWFGRQTDTRSYCTRRQFGTVPRKRQILDHIVKEELTVNR
jgi:hypothetical protein